MSWIIRNKGVDLIKVLAIITMVVDHLRYLIPKYQLEFIAVGRMAFIMFACSLAFNAFNMFESKKYESIRVYFKNLIFFGLISEVPYRLASGGASLGTHNIMLTLLLGMLLISIMNVRINAVTKIVLFLAFSALCIWFDSNIEFGFLGVLLMPTFYCMFKFSDQLRIRNVFIIIAFVLACLCNLQYYMDIVGQLGFGSVWVYSMLLGCIFGTVLAVSLSLGFISLNNAKVAKVGKWAWWFYPVHLSLIYLLSLLL